MSRAPLLGKSDSERQEREWLEGLRYEDKFPDLSRLGDCPTCEGRHTHGSGRPNGVDCRCGRHFHFGDDLWVRTDKCIVCPSCGHALSPLDIDQDGAERVR